jgi:hypothetical protein
LAELLHQYPADRDQQRGKDQGRDIGANTAPFGVGIDPGHGPAAGTRLNLLEPNDFRIPVIGLSSRPGHRSGTQQIAKTPGRIEVGGDNGAPSRGLAILAPAIDLESGIEFGGGKRFLRVDPAFDQR